MLEITKKAFLPSLVICLVLVAIGLTFFSPLYSDEFAYKIYLERYFINGGFKQSVAPFCPEGFLVRPGALLIPAAVVWSAISQFGSNWLSYRIIPFLGILIVYAALIIHNVRRGNHSFWPLLLLITLGPTLYGLILLRPEILILSVGMLMYLLGQAMLGTRRESFLYLYSVIMLMLFSLIAYVHPKALYLLLVVVASIMLASSKIERKLHRIFFVGLFVLGGLSIAQAGIDLHRAGFLSCSTAPGIERTINTQAVNPLNLFEKPLLFVEDMKTALDLKAVKLTFLRMFFAESYETTHLPERETTNVFNVWANELIAATVGFFIIYIVWKSISCLRFLKDKDEKKQFYLVGSVVLALSLPFLFSITKHFYEVAFFQASLMIMAALLWPFNTEHDGKLKSLLSVRLLSFLVIASVLCLALVYINYTKAFLLGYEGLSPYSRADRTQIEGKVQQALSVASIPDTTPIIMDDLTYDAVRKHPIVIHVTNLVQVGDIPDIVKLALDRYQVHYGITACPMSNWLGSIVPIERVSTISFERQPNGQFFNTAEMCLFKVK